MMIEKLDYIPVGYVRMKNLSSPPNYIWFNNNKSRFSKGYHSVLVKKEVV
jgi:hypothetical protein